MNCEIRKNRERELLHVLSRLAWLLQAGCGLARPVGSAQACAPKNLHCQGSRKSQAILGGGAACHRPMTAPQKPDRGIFCMSILKEQTAVVAPSSGFLVFGSQFHEKSSHYLLSFISSCRKIYIDLTKKLSCIHLCLIYTSQMTSSGSSKIMFEKKPKYLTFLTVVLQGPLGFLTETLMFQNFNNF